MEGGRSLVGDARAAVRLRPEMVSLRLHVLSFVRLYLGKWRASPSYGEISRGLGISRRQVKDAVESLVREGLLLKAPGPRGLAMPSQRDAALRTLRALGYVVDDDRQLLHTPEPDFPLPEDAHAA